jgi:hypothetical protein
MEKAQGFALRIVCEIAVNLIGTLHLVGDRVELFDTFARVGPVTAVTFANEAEVIEQHSPDWLSAMACCG